jgi:hypothetical protein
MATGRRIAVRASAAVIAAAMLWPSSSARADCSFNDFLNAVENLGSSISSSACDAAYASGVGVGLIVGLGGALSGVMAEDSNAGNQICQQVQNDFNNLGNASNDLGTLQGIFSQYPAAAGLLQTAQQTLGDVANPLASAACACDWVQGIGQLGGDVLACLQDAICGLQEDLGWGGCGCTPPTPVLANCTPPIETCTGYSGNPNDPACTNAIYGRNGDNPPSTIVEQTANGTIVIDVSDGWNGHSKYCAPDRYCFCPSPMTLVPVDNLIADGGNPANGYVMYVCECPSETTAAAQSGPLAELCLCNNTGLPAVAPVKSSINPEGSICPIPLTGIPCPQGQVNVGGKCVPPCATNEVRTPGGTCCNPNNVSMCGVCCPPGTTPNLTNGSCNPSQVTQ